MAYTGICRLGIFVSKETLIKSAFPLLIHSSPFPQGGIQDPFADP
jgi:hypothetical protein